MALTPERSEQFETYWRLLVEWNERMNLTAITEREAVYEKHFYDSLTLAFHLDLNGIGRLADIGSGAGFPSLPLKILNPHLEVLIVDSLGKRIRFLEHLTAELGLAGVTCCMPARKTRHEMLEHRDGYDLVTARAVARMNVLSEFCLPFARPCRAVRRDEGPRSRRGNRGGETRAFPSWAASWRRCTRWSCPFEQAGRHIVIIRKRDGRRRRYPAQGRHSGEAADRLNALRFFRACST